MLSRWQEAALSRKYEAILTENRALRQDLLNTEQLLINEEKEHHRLENALQEQLLVVAKKNKEI